MTIDREIYIMEDVSTVVVFITKVGDFFTSPFSF